ncbi:RraA family protein [Burkholderia sp. MR1-5-21]
MSLSHIYRRTHEVTKDIVDAFHDVPVANISDVMMRLTAAGARLRPMHDGAYLCGPAYTVKTRPGDNLLVHKAIDLASPGDVIVVDAGGDLTNAIIGELMSGYAASRGIGGIVINGAVRDADGLRKSSFPVYAAGVTHRGPYKDGPGQINVPIAIDGMVIRPGDLIVGDADGLLCIALEDVHTVLAAAVEKHRQEIKTVEDIANGSLDTSWVDAALARSGCVVEAN